MYQHIWYNNNSPEIQFVGSFPNDWIMDDKIEAIMLTCWCEHCLECAVPLCYNNCENWVDRVDRKCQKTFYGTKFVEVNGYKGALLRFRKWGKLEAWLNENGVSPQKYNRAYSINRIEETVCKIASNVIKFLSPTMKLCGAQNVFRDKRFCATQAESRYNVFLVQYYSPSDKEYNLIIELYTSNETYYRNAFKVKKGFNQIIINITDVDLRLTQKPRARLYPENNICEDIVFFRSDFVRLRQTSNLNNVESAKKVKCVAWDLDRTVWDGILIESEPENLTLRNGVKEAIQELDNRGIIQIVVSKNEFSDVEPQLKRLGIYDMFVYIMANWNSKSDNLKKAAKLINININTFALVDDSKYERGEVKENIPQIRVFDENEFEKMLSYPEFDVPVTEDGKNRRIMYQTEVKRKSIEESFEGTNLDFLRNCYLEVKIKPIDDEYFDRSYELVQRTNQLNLSGIKYSESDFRDLCFNSGRDCYVATCSDKYGDYGQVGFFCIDVNKDTVFVKEYAMSCRVASKWIEPELMKWLLEKYAKDNLVFDGVDSKKNGLLIRTLQSFGLENKANEPNELYLEIERSKMTWVSVVTIIDSDNKVK